MEHLIAGGLVRKLKRNQFDDPTPVIDLRHIDDRNCFELPKQRVKSSSPESLSAQLKMDCGYDERRRSTTAVRLSQCGIFFYRAEVEKQNPDTWFSWMKEDDERHRPKEEYAVLSTGPSLCPPFNPPHPPIVAKFKPKNERAVNKRLFSSSSSSVTSSMPYPYILSNNP